MLYSTVLAHNLVNVHILNPTIVVDLRYATTNNFTQQKLYDYTRAYLIKPAAQALDAVQKELAQHGFGLKIWDAYRPVSVQKKLWKIRPDTRYVADPQKGSRHNRGAAVDCTLIDLKTHKELAMPTEFDDFSEKAHADYMALSQKVLKNRALLQKIMQRHSFKIMKFEWWHFDFQNWENYPLLDINCKDIP